MDAEQREVQTTSSSKRMFASASNVESVLGEKPLNGYWTTLMHLSKSYIGTGIFAMGEGFKFSGLLLGPLLLGLFGAMSVHCQHILVRTADKIAEEEGGEVKPTFAETVQYTMELSKIKLIRNHSKNFGLITNIFLCLCEAGFCCVYFVFIAEHLAQVAEHFGILNPANPWRVHIVLAIILIPMWGSTFLTNLKLLLPLSIISNTLMWIGILIILYYTVGQGLPPVSERNLVANYETWPLFFGTAFYVFEGITMVIPLRNEMRKVEQFDVIWGVLNVGVGFVVCLFLLVGTVGYWKYGDNVRSSIFLNLAEEDKLVGDITDVMISIAVLFTFTLHMYIPFEITFPLFFRKYGPFKHGRLVSYIYRAVPVLITWTLANIVPFLGLFISLVGATGGGFLSFILPPILELIAFQGELTWFIIIKNILILAIGTTGSTVAIILSVSRIINKFRTVYGGGE